MLDKNRVTVRLLARAKIPGIKPNKLEHKIK